MTRTNREVYTIFFWFLVPNPHREFHYRAHSETPGGGPIVKLPVGIWSYFMKRPSYIESRPLFIAVRAPETPETPDAPKTPETPETTKVY